ncbi:MAG TPA: sorbosone dehydrogenase family protein [Bacteroidia bacterium]|jgi:glucose/arabinose dehydrogenase|nr:sorbosone dehydrogenase family protein [Bacteroidia bacterium]
MSKTTFKNELVLFAVAILVATTSFAQKKDSVPKHISSKIDLIDTVSDPALRLPKPYATKSVDNRSQVIGWKDGKMPIAPEGFVVSKFADGFENPRWIYIGPNGDVFVSEAATRPNSANRVTLLRDENKDGTYETRETFLSQLNRPFGMLIMGNYFYVANTDGLLRFPYTAGQKAITAKGEKILELPAGGYNNHWTRNIIASADGKKILVSVGSGSNVGENGMDKEVRRACILVIDPDGKGEKMFASGLRNPVGMDFAPGTLSLWTAVNERDELGDDLVPDYITSVKEGGFYGWPYSYFGQNEDPRLKGQRPDLVKQAIIPDIAVGSHTASLGLAFYKAKAFPEKYRNGVFIAQHGSWNRSQLSGYKVLFVPFTNGKQSGKPEDFLTGFIANEKESKVYGRPVCIAILPDGSMLVSDDASNTIWQIKPLKNNLKLN